MNKFLSFVETVLKKCNIMATMAALALTSLLYFLIPELRNFDTMSALVCLIGLFAFSFLIVSLVQWLSNKASKWCQKRREQVQIYDKNKEILLDILDRAHFQERNAVEYFIEHNNEPVLCDMPFEMYEMHEVGQLFAHKEVRVERCRSGIDFFTQKPITFKKGRITNECKLKDEVYETLRNIKKETGKISRI